MNTTHPIGEENRQPLVRFIGVRKSYGAITVVRDLNLDIFKGEFLTLLGPSGSGKTTTLMMLAGFQDATAGDILLGGKPITQTPAHDRGIGMVFQSYALFPHMTVAQNLAFPLEVRGVGKGAIAERVKRALEMVELPAFGARRPAQLSGGQQQRVALARALIFEPQVVLMDEPLGALDKHLREQMQYEIKALHGRLGTTMVYVTHDQSEALTMSDRIAVFNDGVVQQLATPSELYERPATAFVAQFIGENNAFSGEVVDWNSALCTVRLSGGDTIRASYETAPEQGRQVKLSIRPERVHLGQSPSAGANRVTGKVLDRIYHGDHIRVKFAAAGSDNFIAKIPNRGPDIAIEPGSTHALFWNPEDCRIFL